MSMTTRPKSNSSASAPPASWSSLGTDKRNGHPSVAAEEPCSHGIESLLAQHPNGDATTAEQRLEGVVENVEAAREGTERRHHETASVADEARPADRIAVHRKARRGVHVARYFVR